jgi:predicted transcriptional regulator
MNKHRSQEDIIADILAIVVNEPKKTHIMYGANLSYSLLRKYLDLLLDAQLIRYQEDERTYTLTPSGKEYLSLYTEFKSVEDVIASKELQFNEKKTALLEMLKYP